VKREEVTSQLADLIDEVLPEFGAVEITPEVRLREELGMDSLSQVDLISRVERVYRITIPDEDLGSFVVIGDLVDYVLARTGATR
jgi:acyl carrier protein